MDMMMPIVELDPADVSIPERDTGSSLRRFARSDSKFGKCVVCSELTGSSLQPSFLLNDDPFQMDGHISISNYVFKEILERDPAPESELILCAECCSAVETSYELEKSIRKSQTKLLNTQLFLRRRFEKAISPPQTVDEDCATEAPWFAVDKLCPSAPSEMMCFSAGSTRVDTWPGRVTQLDEHVLKSEFEWSDSLDNSLNSLFSPSPDLESEESVECISDKESENECSVISAPKCDSPRNMEKIGIPIPELSPTLPSHANSVGSQPVVEASATGPMEIEHIEPVMEAQKKNLIPPQLPLKTMDFPLRFSLACSGGQTMLKMKNMSTFQHCGGGLIDLSQGASTQIANSSTPQPIPLNVQFPQLSSVIHTNTIGVNEQTKTNYVDIKSLIQNKTSSSTGAQPVAAPCRSALILLKKTPIGQKTGGETNPQKYSIPPVTYYNVITDQISCLKFVYPSGPLPPPVPVQAPPYPAPNPEPKKSIGDEMKQSNTGQKLLSPEALVGAPNQRNDPKVLEDLRKVREISEASAAAAHKQMGRTRGKESVKCRVCPRSFNFEDENGVCCHIDKHNKRFPLICPFCEYAPTSMENLLEHTRCMHTVKGKCPICGIVCKTEKKKLMHASKHAFFSNCEHKYGNYWCKWCSTEFVRKEMIQRHWRTRHSTQVEKDVYLYFQSVTCPACSKDFTSLQQLAAHNSAVHKLSLWACPLDECTKQLETVEHLIYHVTCDHSPEEPFLIKCQLCSSQFHDWLTLQTHVSETHLKNKTIAPYPVDMEEDTQAPGGVQAAEPQPPKAGRGRPRKYSRPSKRRKR